jgi:multidrug efflux system membrane fusion protein
LGPWAAAKESVVRKFSVRGALVFAGVAAVALTVAVGASTAAYFILRSNSAEANNPPVVVATPVSVATVEQRDVALWDEFSGRLEAVERVEVRSRVAGVVQAVHFREGALVKQGDLLTTIDPAPYAAEVARTQAQVTAAEARVLLTRNELERGEQLSGSRTISQRDLDQRLNANHEAEANLAAARAALQASKLNLDWTGIRAPVTGRVGRLEMTVGNLVAAGPGAPVLTTLVSVDPIYASFNADEQVVARALRSLAELGVTDVGRIPVRMTTVTGTEAEGRMQLIDNQVDARSGTVRVRAVFGNADGSLMPGQFARLRMGQPRSTPALAVNERAVGTDQSKRFVMVVDADNKAEYREITLGPVVHDGLRVVTSGLKPGEQIIVNGLQRVRPGARVAPQQVRMDARPELQARHAGSVAER